MRLLTRTTKSVTLTAAGEALVRQVDAPYAAIGSAIEMLNRFRDTPSGRIRINVVVDAAALLLAPVLPAFMDRYHRP